MNNWKTILKMEWEKNFLLKKIIGVILIIIGFLALVTPFTPGSWLIFVGLGLLGIRIGFWENIKARYLK